MEGADVRWSANDALGIFSGTKFVNAKFTTKDDNAASATFTGDATDAEGTEAAKAFAYYPYAAGATLEGTTVSGLEIPAVQTRRLRWVYIFTDEDYDRAKAMYDERMANFGNGEK